MDAIWTKWEPCFWPKALMFLSVDVVGSTALKQTTIPRLKSDVVPDNSAWFNLIQLFYEQTLTRVFREYHRATDYQQEKPFVQTMKRPVFWKTIGDEVLLWIEVSDCRQVPIYLSAWKLAIEGLRKDLRAVNPRLDVKCAAWVAQVPWRNKLLVSSRTGRALGASRRPDHSLQLMKQFFAAVEEEESQIETSDGFCGTDLVADFIGPGIDIGFRLAKFASARRFIISADVAYMLATAIEEGEDAGKLSIQYEGLQQLAGTMGGLEYPIFWIDMAEKRKTIDAFGPDLRRREPCETEDVLAFCKLFYGERSNYLYTPFLVSETERCLTEPPQWYVEAHLQMLREAGIPEKMGVSG